MSNFPVVIEPTAQDVVHAAAERFVAVAQQSVAARGRFTVALAGGSTPRALYELLALYEWSERVPWPQTHVFWGDERAVAPDSKDSNNRMARETLLDQVGIPPQNIRPMRGDAEDLDDAARDYEAQLRAMNGPLDLVLLGMGDDGHTASLVPGYSALRETERWCVATGVSPTEPRVPRLTLTLPCINAARHVLVLVTGGSKAARVAQVISGLKNGVTDSETLPIQGVQPRNGDLTWMLDASAARLLGD